MLVKSPPEKVCSIGIALAMAIIARPSFLILAAVTAEEAIEAQAAAINSWRNNVIVRDVSDTCLVCYETATSSSVDVVSYLRYGTVLLFVVYSSIVQHAGVGGDALSCNTMCLFQAPQHVTQCLQLCKASSHIAWSRLSNFNKNN
jgi:hypothetical protein